MIDEEMDNDMDIAGGPAEGSCALDFLLEGSLELEAMKIDLAHYLFKGRDCLARELKAFVHTLCTESSVRERVEAEVAKLATEGAAGDWKVAGSMVETNRVCKEVKRIHPVTPMPWRTLTTDLKVGSTLIQSGSRVCLAYHETHQDGAQYNEPTKCDPDRFSVERAEDKKNNGWCYVPHGTGVMGKVHRCPAEPFFAQTLKVLAITLANNCSWTAAAGQDFSLNDDLTFAGPLMMDMKAK